MGKDMAKEDVNGWTEQLTKGSGRTTNSMGKEDLVDQMEKYMKDNSKKT